MAKVTHEKYIIEIEHYKKDGDIQKCPTGRIVHMIDGEVVSSNKIKEATTRVSRYNDVCHKPILLFDIQIEAKIKE